MRLGTSGPVGELSLVLVLTVSLVMLSACARRPVNTAASGESGAHTTSSVIITVTDTEPGAETTAGTSPESVPEPASIPAAVTSGSGTAGSGTPVFTCAGATSNMILDLISDFTGQASPIEAARFFVSQSWAATFTAPVDAVWMVTSDGARSVYVSTDNLRLHVVQSATNDTWTVDEAVRCA